VGWVGSGGCWAVAWLGPGCGPVGLSPFFFVLNLFLFLFSISSITFAFATQMTSNQLCKVSKIQDNNPEQ
jgi:hypothetical protein